jgi:site-specific recombinase XerD
MKKKTTAVHSPDIPSLLKRFLLDHLQRNRSVSPNTLRTYADTFRMLLQYLQQKKHVRPERIALSDLSSKNILAFLDHLESERKNKITTRNTRLAIIHSFVKYLLVIDPTLAGDLHGVLAIPMKKSKKPALDFLTDEEMDVLLEIPDKQTWIGRRDLVLLTVMYNTGARVSETVGMRVADVTLGTGGTIRLFGKGRKERTLPLWKNTVKLLKDWIRENGYTEDMPLFQSNRRTAMTRSSVEKRLALVVSAATKRMPSLKKRTISPHTLRHSTAMYFLNSGVDITVISMWLGHESLQTTHIYISSDMKLKEKALKTLQEPSLKGFRYKPKDSMLAFLEDL